MAKRERPISVLWIDDQISELKEFPQYAASQRVIIRNSFESAEEGIEELTQNVNKYQAVILDAKAFRKKGQAKGTENFKSLRDSINNIRQLEKDLNRKIPHCVYTGHIDKMGEAWEDDLKIFIKGKDQDNLLQFLKDEIKNLPETKIVQHYSEAFEAFENKLDATLKGSLIYVLGNLDSKQQQVIKNSLVEMRKILEGIYLDLCTQKYLHPICLQNGRPNLEYCQRFLAGLDVNGVIPPKPIAPPHISWELKVIKENTSALGAHYSTTTNTNYFLKAMVFALLDVLVWYNDFRK